MQTRAGADLALRQCHIENGAEREHEHDSGAEARAHTLDIKIVRQQEDPRQRLVPDDVVEESDQRRACSTPPVGGARDTERTHSIDVQWAVFSCSAREVSPVLFPSGNQAVRALHVYHKTEELSTRLTSGADGEQSRSRTPMRSSSGSLLCSVVEYPDDRQPVSPTLLTTAECSVLDPITTSALCPDLVQLYDPLGTDILQKRFLHSSAKRSHRQAPPRCHRASPVRVDPCRADAARRMTLSGAAWWSRR